MGRHDLGLFPDAPRPGLQINTVAQQLQVPGLEHDSRINLRLEFRPQKTKTPESSSIFILYISFLTTTHK